MKVSSFDWDGNDPRGLAAEIRALQPSLGEVGGSVAEIIEAVRTEGDIAVARFEQRHGGVAPASLRVPPDEIERAPGTVSDELISAIRTAIANVAATTEAEADGRSFGRSAAGGSSITISEVPVASAGAYAPGGAGAYPSTAIMCCVPARAAGVERIAVASPPGSDGRVNPAVLAACSLAGAVEVYAMGGAQAIAALALGTETVEPVDVVVGPGNRYVQEAKRQLVGRVGIDGIAGPSELMVVADAESNLRNLALDLCAQVEHGDDGLLVACAVDQTVLDALSEAVEDLERERPTVKEATLAFVRVPSGAAAAELANALAPEHLQIDSGDDQLASQVLYAGCVFVGPLSATAFGDYAVGSNHVLPTGGAGRFSGPLGPWTFRRRLTTVRLSEEDARDLAPVVATLADAEGFPVHGESAMARTNEPEEKRG
jgi:histidinol dehydrogenase